jgi:hypothetical protein
MQNFATSSGPCCGENDPHGLAQQQGDQLILSTPQGPPTRLSIYALIPLATIGQ